MKYYIYISDAKVDMLYPQIPKPLLKRIASSLSIDLKLLGAAELNIGAKSNPSNETRYAKVQIVLEYIEKHLDVGTIDAASTYFKGSLPMWFAPIGLEKRAVFFGGHTEKTNLGLGGSAKHIIGSNETSDAHFSLLTYLLNVLEQEENSLLNKAGNRNDDFWALNAVESAIIEYERGEISRYPQQQVEILAKTLLQGPSNRSPRYSRRYIVLGTPIYVAIAD